MYFLLFTVGVLDIIFQLITTCDVKLNMIKHCNRGITKMAPSGSKTN